MVNHCYATMGRANWAQKAIMFSSNSRKILRSYPKMTQNDIDMANYDCVNHHSKIQVTAEEFFKLYKKYFSLRTICDAKN